MSINDSIPPFDGQPGVWLRSAFHVHTTETDGWLTPAIQRRYHAQAEYDVLAITDHDMLTPVPETSQADHCTGLLTIGGTELSLTAPKSGGPLHLLGIGITTQLAVGRGATLSEAAAAIRAAGGLPYLAHPVWSGLRTDEVDGIEACAGVEIYNASCGVEQDRAHADAHVDVWLSMGHRLHLIATDDTHYPGYDAFQAWTMVHAREKTREAFLEALAAGRFYATSGPRITSLSLLNDRLTVRTTPALSITLLANPPYGAQVRSGSQAFTYRAERLRTADGQALEGTIEGDALTGAHFRWDEGMRYARIVVTDDRGRRAWSNPIWP